MSFIKKNYKEIILWIIIALFYFLLGLNHSVEGAIINSMFTTSGQIFVVKINHIFLFKRYLGRLKSKKFIFIGICIVVALAIFFVGMEYICFSDHIEAKRIEREASTFEMIFFPFMFNTLSYGMAFFVSSSIKLVESERENILHIRELQKIQVETELKFLKTQINPHFLFNALNNIYAISYKGSDEAPQKILDLSDMLRYVIYDCKSDMVPIGKEIEYTKNYIKFQQLKTEKKQNINFYSDTISKNILIAPMLLIPFVENSFKHSKIDKDKNAFVNISIHYIEEEINIKVENSLPEIAPAKMVDNNSGIGLENVKKRLNLIYKNRFKLEINSDTNIFAVSLKIKNK